VRPAGSIAVSLQRQPATLFAIDLNFSVDLSYHLYSSIVKSLFFIFFSAAIVFKARSWFSGSGTQKSEIQTEDSSESVLLLARC
jgi:hypothetical protein